MEKSAAEEKSGRWRSVVLIAIVIPIGSLVFFTPIREHLDPADIQASLQRISAEWWSPLVFILLYCCATTFFFPPATALSLAAGVIWGWFIGGLWVLCASSIASAIPFFIGRSGGGWLAAKIPAQAQELYRKLQNEGFTTLLLLRLVPIVPYTVLNYAAGLASLKTRDYLLATFLGTIPGIFIFTYLADSIAAGAIGGGEAAVRIVTAGVLLAALVLMSRFLAGRVRRRIEP